MLLEIRDLIKVYGKRVRANDGINLGLEAGEVFGLLGHNGAGKTTLINQVVGLARPTSGSITLDGRDVVADPGYARRACSFQAQAQVPINGLTPRQAIELVGQMRGGRRDDVRPAADRLIDALELGQWRDVDGLRLSGGVKRLVSFAMAAVVPGRLVMLDEPTNDVDPVRRRLLWHLVRGLADDGAAVLLVTHNVLEAERSVDRLAILDRGRVITEGTPASLKAGLADDLRLEVVLEPGVEPPEPPPCAGSVISQGHRMLLTVPSAQASDAIAWADGLKRDGRAEEFSLVPVSLEDVYVALVGRAEALSNGESATDAAAEVGLGPAPAGSGR